jgi:hypothetical protein
MEIVAQSSAGSASIVDRKARARSRLSNGRGILPDVDGRSALARRYRDISGAILTDQGGADRCSESRLQLIRRFAAAAVLAEQLESRLANGEQVDINEHATLSSTLVRLASRIGIDRVPREVGPSLSDLLRADLDDHRRGAAEPVDVLDGNRVSDTGAEENAHHGDDAASCDASYDEASDA